jgi:hypothetical protein
MTILVNYALAVDGPTGALVTIVFTHAANVPDVLSWLWQASVLCRGVLGLLGRRTI